MTLQDLIDRLAHIDPDAVAAVSLSGLAHELAGGVRDALSEPPGGQSHLYPWLRTGELRDSIGSSVEFGANGPEAVVGSTSNVALYQEHGTSTAPPRPFLAPLADERGEAIARAVGAAVAAALSPSQR